MPMLTAIIIRIEARIEGMGTAGRTGLFSSNLKVKYDPITIPIDGIIALKIEGSEYR